MDKSIVVKRKAQKLVRDGQIDRAIAELGKILGEAEADPYDHVYFGDLQIRLGRTAEAVAAWRTAVRSYESVGLYRNAIAICKKILRVDAAQTDVHRTLGDLYLREGLNGEAVPHFLAYLDSFNGSAELGSEFEEVLDQAAAITGLQVETALRLSDFYSRLNREDRAGELLHGLADEAATGGSVELSEELRDRARCAEAKFLSLQSAEGGGESWAGARLEDSLPERPPVAPPEPSRKGPLSLELDLNFDETDADSEGGIDVPHAPETNEEELSELSVDAPEIAEATSPGDDGVDPPPAAEGIAFAYDAGTPQPQPERSGVGGFVVEHFPAPSGPGEDDAPLDGPSTHDAWESQAEAAEAASETRAAVGGRSSEDGLNVDEGAPPAPYGDPAAELDSFAAPLEPDGEDLEALPFAVLSGRIDEAMAGENWAEARRLAEIAHHRHPQDRDVLDRLVRIGRHVRDESAVIHYLTLLGDAWIDEGDLQEALQSFLQVLRLAPEEPTARRRLARFRDMGVPGVEEVPEEAGNSIPGVLETSGAHVAVAGDSGIRSDEWVDLGALLEEFKAGIKNQIDGADFQSHYDLAVSHQSMGLFEEALEELDTVLEQAQLPAEMIWRAREMKGTCLLWLQRHREAVHEFREALEAGVGEGETRWSILYHLGRALEEAGEWREAAESYEQVLADGRNFLDAASRAARCRSREAGEPGSNDEESGTRAA